MILNAYAVLDLGLSALRLVVAILVLALATRLAMRARYALAAEDTQRVDNSLYLLSLLGLLLVVLNFLSWPLLYVLLHSYVALWPGSMCIYGITRIGEGSTDLSRMLPGLITAMQASKPGLVFCSGAWVVLYLINRQTTTGPLRTRVVATLLCVGVLGSLDAVVECAYVLIPKQGESFSSGCCTTVFDDPVRGVWLAPDPVLGPADRPVLTTAHFVSNAALVLALSGGTASMAQMRRLMWTLGMALVALPLAVAMLLEVVAPTVLQLPYHHCPYDLVPVAPEVLVAAGLYLGGVFCIGWACVAAIWGRSPETQSWLAQSVATLLRLGRFCYVAAMVMIAVELALP